MLDKIIEEFYCMKRDKVGDHERPHKPALLLALINQVDAGLIQANDFSLTKKLEANFKLIFDLVNCN